MVFYRKYRPQTIQELDNQKLRTLLATVLSTDSFPHAFLFTGSKGLGKTSTARIVAKVVNCQRWIKAVKKEAIWKKEKLDTGEIPCNKCEQCVSITEGMNMDVLEIDGASNRGIDEIRDLREKIRLLPVMAEKKVYIIDEVHMLTTEAFNALLKTLEEPPAHAMFVLCTTEAHKVPDTILSRCFHVPFTRATTDELIHSFSRIAKGEKISVADDALYLIATLSDGSFRDGAKIFEEVVASVQEKNIDKKDVENLYNTLHVSSLVEIVVQAFIKKDLQAGLEALGKIESYGIDTAYFMDQLLSWLHSMLLQASGVKASKGEEPTQPFLPLSAIKDILKTVMKAEKEFRFAQLPQLPLEIALIEWCSKEAVVKEGVRQEPVTVENVSQPTTQQKPADTTFWYQIIDAIKEKNYTVAGVLRGCRLKLFDEKTFIIETQHLFHKEQLEKDTAKTLLHDVIKALSGKDVLVNVELRGGE